MTDRYTDMNTETEVALSKARILIEIIDWMCVQTEKKGASERMQDLVMDLSISMDDVYNRLKEIEAELNKE